MTLVGQSNKNGQVWLEGLEGVRRTLGVERRGVGQSINRPRMIGLYGGQPLGRPPVILKLLIINEVFP